MAMHAKDHAFLLSGFHRSYSERMIKPQWHLNSVMERVLRAEDFKKIFDVTEAYENCVSFIKARDLCGVVYRCSASPPMIRVA